MQFKNYRDFVALRKFSEVAIVEHSHRNVMHANHKLASTVNLAQHLFAYTVTTIFPNWALVSR